MLRRGTFPVGFTSVGASTLWNTVFRQTNVLEGTFGIAPLRGWRRPSRGVGLGSCPSGVRVWRHYSLKAISRFQVNGQTLNRGPLNVRIYRIGSALELA